MQLGACGYLWGLLRHPMLLRGPNLGLAQLLYVGPLPAVHLALNLLDGGEHLLQRLAHVDEFGLALVHISAQGLDSEAGRRS